MHPFISPSLLLLLLLLCFAHVSQAHLLLHKAYWAMQDNPTRVLFGLNDICAPLDRSCSLPTPVPGQCPSHAPSESISTSDSVFDALIDSLETMNAELPFDHLIDQVLSAWPLLAPAVRHSLERMQPSDPLATSFGVDVKICQVGPFDRRLFIHLSDQLTFELSPLSPAPTTYASFADFETTFPMCVQRVAPTMSLAHIKADAQKSLHSFIDVEYVEEKSFHADAAQKPFRTAPLNLTHLLVRSIQSRTTPAIDGRIKEKLDLVLNAPADQAWECVINNTDIFFMAIGLRQETLLMFKKTDRDKEQLVYHYAKATGFDSVVTPYQAIPASDCFPRGTLSLYVSFFAPEASPSPDGLALAELLLQTAGAFSWFSLILGMHRHPSSARMLPKRLLTLEESRFLARYFDAMPRKLFERLTLIRILFGASGLHDFNLVLQYNSVLDRLEPLPIDYDSWFRFSYYRKWPDHPNWHLPFEDPDGTINQLLSIRNKLQSTAAQALDQDEFETMMRMPDRIIALLQSNRTITLDQLISAA